MKPSEYPEEAKTEWFPSSVKPVRHGTYEVRFTYNPHVVVTRVWKGAWFINAGRGVLNRSSFGRSFPLGYWRGLREPAKSM